MIKVLVVDDSAFMRVAISKMLESDPEIEVLATADNGLQAIEKLKTLKPDVITMDVEMPQMDGITAVKEIVRITSTPIVMLSSVTTDGADITMEALEVGATDFICKPSRYASLDIMNIKREILDKVRLIGKSGKRGIRPLVKKRVSSDQPPEKSSLKHKVGANSVLAIGTSTGGPKALYRIIPQIPATLQSPIFIVQHMPAGFTKSLAEHLNRLSAITIKEAEDGEEVQSGTAYIAPGNLQMQIKNDQGKKTIEISEKIPDMLHNPSVDVMMLSVAAAYRHRAMGVIMTGMGRDGADGLKAIHDAGGRTITEAEESCIVYGMPRAAVEVTKVDRIVPLERIVETVLELI